MAATSKAAGSPLRVLLLENGADAHARTPSLLQEAGHAALEVVRASTWPEALELLARCSFDAVLLGGCTDAEIATHAPGDARHELNLSLLILLAEAAHLWIPSTEGDPGTARTLEESERAPYAPGDILDKPVQPRRLTESVLREALRVEARPDGVLVLDTGGRIIDVNPAAERLYGDSRHALLGQRVALWFRPEETFHACEQIRDESGHAGPRAGDVRLVRQDSVEGRNDARITVLCGRDGSPMWHIGVSRDDSEGERAERSRRENEHRFQALAESAPIGIFLSDREGKGIYQNPRWTAISGLSPAETDGQGWIQAIHPADRELVVQEWVRANDQREGFRHRCRLVRADGEVRTVDINAVAWLGSAGEFFGHVGTVQDITEPDAAAQALRFKSALLEAQSEAAVEGILVVGPNRELLSFNRRFREMWQLPEEVLASRSDEQGLAWVMDRLQDAEEFMATLEYLYHNPEVVASGEVALKDGTVFKRFTAPVVGEHGEYFGRAFYFRDITEQRRHEEAIRIATERAHQMATRMRAVAIAASSMALAGSVEDLMQTVHQACAQVMTFDAFMFAQYRPESHELDFHGVYDGSFVESPGRIPVAGTPSERVIRERRSLLTLRSADPASSGAMVWGKNRRSESVIRTPMVWGDRVLGVISVQSYSPDLYTQDDVEVLETVAAVACATLVNLELKSANEAAVAALRESEERFRLVVNSLGEGLLLTDLDEQVVYVNPRATEITGYTSEELVGRVASEVLLPPQERAQVERETSTRATGRESRYEVQHVHKDGALLWVEVHGVPFRNPAGEVIGTLGVMQDVTARKMVEESLLAAEAELRAVFSAMIDVILVFDSTGRFVKIPPTNPVLLYRPSHEMLGRRVHEVLPPDVADVVCEAIQTVLGTQSTVQTEYRLEISGRDVWFSAVISPMGEDAVVWVARDITDHKQAEEERAQLVRELQNERARLSSVFMQAPAFIATVQGPDHVFEMANPAYHQLVGDRQLVGRSVRQVFPELRDQGFFELLDEVLRTGVPFVGTEMPILLQLTPEGPPEERFIDFVYQPMFGTAGEAVGIFCHGVDVTHQVRARNTVEHLAAERGAILQQIADGVVVLDPGGHITYLNQAAEGMLGRIEPGTPVRSEAPGFRILTMEGAPVAPRDLPGMRALRDQRAVTGQELQIEKPDGALLVVEASATPVSAENGCPLGAVVVLRNTTDRRQAAEKLEAAEQHYRRLVENSPDGIFMLDLERRFTEMNQTLADLIGITPQEAIGRVGTTWLVPEDRERANESHRTKLSGEAERTDNVYRLRRVTGEERVIQIRSVPVRENGQVTGAHGVVRDVTEERTRDQKIRLLAAALENLDNGVSVVRLNGDIVYANGAFTRVLEMEPGCQRLPHLESFLPDQPAREQLAAARRAVRLDGSWSGRLSWQSPRSGERIDLDAIVGMVDGQQPEPLLLLIVTDAGEAVERENRLRRVERLASLGTLVGGVAHELNNPLHAISNFAELMLMQQRAADDREFLEIIQREADRAAKIVSDLRLVARQTQERTGAREEVDLNDIVRHVLKIRRYALQTGNIEVREDLATDLPPVLANRSEIEQVVLNLVVNAEQALDKQETRRLILRTRRTTGGAAVYVVDTGRGIPAEHLERIYDPFWTTKPPGEGTGLGLSLVHNIVMEHQGEIDVESEVGKGTAFRVELQRVRVETRSRRDDETSTPVRSLRILVVDDEEAIRHASTRFLERVGHQVHAAADGLEALRLLESAHYDVIVSDIRMPGLSGETLLGRLRDLGGGLERRLIFVTGDTANAESARMIADAGVPVLAKPVRLKDLVRGVEHVAGRGNAATRPNRGSNAG